MFLYFSMYTAPLTQRTTYGCFQIERQELLMGAFKLSTQEKHCLQNQKSNLVTQVELSDQQVRSGSRHSAKGDQFNVVYHVYFFGGGGQSL